MRVASLALVVAFVLVPGAGAAGGGSGTYTASAATYAFNLVNGGSAPWQYFLVVGSPETRFVGGTTSNEGSAHCVVGQPDGRPNEIECGPVSANVAPPGGHVGFFATLSAFPSCGAPFELYSSSDGVAAVREDRRRDIRRLVHRGATEGAVATEPARRGSGRAHPEGDTRDVERAAGERLVPVAALLGHTLCADRGRDAADARADEGMARRGIRFVSVASFPGVQVTSASNRLVVRT